jgi:hypothetical protein
MSESPGVTLLAPTIQMAFACENISTDPTGRLTFVNVVDGLFAPIFPASTASLFAIFGFVSQTAGFLLKPKIEVTAEDGTVVASAVLQDMAFKPDAPVARAIVGFPGITWPAGGNYMFKFFANNVVRASFSVKISPIPTPGGQLR